MPTAAIRFTTAPANYSGVANGKGKVDNNLYSGLFLYSVAGHTFGGGYQVSNGSSDFPWLNQGDGSSNYTITDSQIQKFARAGERTGKRVTRLTSPKSVQYLA